MIQVIFGRNFVKSPPNLILFGIHIANTIECLPHISYVNALPCKTQMLKTVTSHGHYQ